MLPFDMPFGVGMLAPILMGYGSKEQQDRFLPDIRARKVNWCQGYSEPGAGSDLAALKTKAELSADGKTYTVNGTKIWTTAAHMADWIFCLTRTEDTGKRQEGITFLLFPMKQPGIEVKPIITLGGSHTVNMVHITDVKVPVENRIGEEGQGWTYAKGLLQHERTGREFHRCSSRSQKNSKNRHRVSNAATVRCSMNLRSARKWLRSKSTCSRSNSRNCAASLPRRPAQRLVRNRRS
jgi:alkylation response protein AidB-like acyl-CoA dehydrogenase